MADDAAMVEQLLGRAPMGHFVVTVRRHDRSPVVVANAPLFENGRPMPTGTISKSGIPRFRFSTFTTQAAASTSGRFMPTGIRASQSVAGRG